MSINPLDVLSNQLGNTVFEFVDAASEVWPECSALKSRLAEAKAAAGTPESAREYSAKLSKTMLEHSDLFDRLLAKDLTVFQSDVELFKELSIYEKLNEAPKDVQDTCWQYIEKIVQSVNLNAVYTSAPTEIMSKVSKVAEDIVSKLESGQFDLSTLNPAQLTQEIMKDMDPEAMQKWAATSLNPSSIGSLMGVMKDVLGKSGGQNLDLQSLLSGGEQDMDMMKSLMGNMFQQLKKN
jgi:hypothetical protein